MEFVAIAGRVGMDVGDAPVDFGQARGVRVTEIGGLHRGGLQREHPQPVPGGVPGQVDQDVDAVGADLLRRFHVTDAGDLASVVGQLHEAGGHGVRPGHVGVAIHVEPTAVVLREHRLDEVRHRVAAEIARDVADAQLPSRIAAV